MPFFPAVFADITQREEYHTISVAAAVMVLLFFSRQWLPFRFEQPERHEDGAAGRERDILGTFETVGHRRSGEATPGVVVPRLLPATASSAVNMP